MQRAILDTTDMVQIRTQAIRVAPGHGTGVHGEALNDDDFGGEAPLARMVFAVMANALGGALLLAGLFLLPQIVAVLLY